MKQHPTDLSATSRKSVKRTAAGAGRPSRWFRKPTLELLEDRELLAASFFAPAEPSGSVNVQLVPLANVTAGTPEIVTFGVPFTRGSVSLSQLSQVRVLKNGVEVPAFVESLTPWRSIDDAGIDGQSVRVARIQIPYTFSSLNPESVTVQWGGPARALNRATMQDPRLEWHTVTSGTFTAADNVEEPDVLPVLPREVLAKGLLDARTQPTANGVAETRDDPAAMNAMTFPGYTEYDYAEKNFFYTIINQNPGISIDYKTQAEPWLYDRSAGMYELYLRSGFATALREAVRSTDFYVDHLGADGFFTLKPGDPKYSYNEALAYTYWLLGDNRMLAPISTVVNAFNGTATHWSPNLSFWTERNTGDKLLANEMAYEVTGNSSFKSNVQTIVGDLIWHQNGAGGQLPANRIDGGLYHTGAQHDISEASSADVLIASSWMSALLVDPMVRVYGIWQDNAQIPDFVIRMGNFEKAASKTDANGQFGGTTRYPDYLMRADGTSDSRSDTDVQHAMDVGAVAAWATYFAELRGTPDASLRQLANDLYATYDVGVNFWTRPGGTNFNVSPPRRYTWEYKNSPSFSWALTATDAPAQPGTLHFSAASYSVNENGGAATITVTRAGGSAGSVSVHYATSDGTATAGSDYTAASGTLTFADGETSKTFTVPIIDDAAVENPETVTLTLNNPTGGAALDPPATATLTIVSDDTTNQPVTATYQQGVNGYAGTTDADISTQYAQYTGGNGSTNVNGDQLGTYQLAGTNGYSVEGLIRFSDLGITSNATTHATVTGATLTLTVDTWTANPTIRGYYLLAPWTTAPGTDLGWVHRGTGQDWATPGALGQGTDLVAGKSFVLPGIIGIGPQVVTVNLDPAVVQSWIDNPSADQGILLVNETTGAVVRVNASENAAVTSRPKLSVSYTVSSAGSSQPGSLQFSNAAYSVSESGGSATVTVTRTGGSAGSVSVHYATGNGTATVGSDYTAASGTLTFADGETSKTFTVPILNDTLVEGSETVNLTLSSPTGGAALGSQATAVLTIQDDDTAQPGSLQFSATAYSVNETQGTATITVTRTGGSNVPVTVHYATSDGTATAGSDYTAVSGTLSFGIGETSKTFTVPILDDTAVESPETVTLTLSSPAGGAALGSPATATLTIGSDDTAGQPTTATYQQGVNGYAGTTDADISTQYAQYTGGNGTTTFNGSQLGVYQTTGSGSYTTEGLIRFGSLGIPANATVTGARLTLTVDTWSANPTVRGYYILAPWSGTPGTSARQLGWLHRGTGQDWATPGALGQGTDVVAAQSFVLPGIRAVGPQTITIDLDPAVVQSWVNNPNADQGILLVNETPGAIVRVNASENPTVATRPKLSVTYSTGGSAPQPGTLQFSTASYAVNENGGTATITVTRTNGSDGTVSVHYATGNGTAAAGSDYTATSGTLTFAAGETSKTFTVPVLNDTAVEGNETVNLTLSSPTGGATLGSQATAVLTIQDDDVAQPGTLQLNAGSYSLTENGGSLTVTVTRTGGTGGTVSVHYATSDGTATAGSDYTAVSGTLTFADGEASKTFTVPVLDDSLVEGNETVTLTLSNPTGGAMLGSPASAALTIVDNDSPPPPPPSGTFTDVTASSGVGAIVNQVYQTNPDWWLSGEHLVDLDNDGDLDLFFDSHGGGNAVVALNDGRGVFTRVTAGSFPTTEVHQMFDVNGDGKVDLSATFQDGGSQWWINHSTPGVVSFTPAAVTRGTNTSRSQVMMDFNGDGKVDWLRSAPPGLVVDLGDGQGGFTEDSLTFPIAGTDSNDNASFLPADFDGDGKTDLLVLVGGNYDGTPGKTLYWHNNGNLTFTDLTAGSGIPLNGTIAKGIGDFDHDGDTDFIAVENKSMPPVIYLNDGHGGFTRKAGAISGVTPGSLDYTSWGTAVTTDFDNDGIADIIMNGKYYLKVLRGTGGGNFTYMNTAWGIKDTAAASLDDGLTFGDIDGDGDLDVIGYNETFPTRTLNVYRNDLAPQSWLNVRPVGLAGNAGAAGAKIRVYAAGTNQLLWYEQVAQYDFQVATSYYGYGETERHVGLGSRANVDVVVEFPSGHVTRINNVAANQTVRVLEGGG